MRKRLDVPLVARVEEDRFPFMLAPVRCVHQVAQTERGVSCEAEVVHLQSTVHVYFFFFVYLMTLGSSELQGYLINNELKRIRKEAVMAYIE